jgi:diguanylate cyclase (GGDEF)-like protein/PAS domain S-box-containing protein
LTPFTKIKLAFGIGVTMLIGSGVAALLQTLRWEESVRKVTESHQVIETLDVIALRAQEPDGFRFAQDSEAALERLTADTPSQKDNLIALRELVRDRAGISGSALRAAILRMETEERRLLAEQTAFRDRQQVFSYEAFAARGLLSLALIFGAGWQILVDRSRRAAAEQALAVREAQYRQVVELAGDIIYRTDTQGRFTFCNQAALSMLHYTEAEVIGRSYLKLIRVDRRRDAQRFYLRQFVRRQKSTFYEFPMIDGHGHVRWVDQNVQLVFDGSEVVGFQAIAREITERKRTELDLQKSRNFIERIAATTPGILYVYDLEERRNVFNNREIITVLGYTPEEIQKFDDIMKVIVHPDDRPMINAHYEALRHVQDGEIRRLEYRARHAEGNWVWLSGRETPFERGVNGLVKQVVGISQDITARKAAQEKLAWQANYDALTGLPNRHHFWTRLQGVLRRASIEHVETALCLFDIDRFKEINDRHGHNAGDEVLEEVGNIVRAELRSNDIPGRLGGDEFCFALPGTDENEAARVAERIRARLSTLAFGMDTGAAFSVTATFGVAQSQRDMDAKHLMEAADRALYRAKSSGRNRVCVDA